MTARPSYDYRSFIRGITEREHPERHDIGGIGPRTLRRSEDLPHSFNRGLHRALLRVLARREAKRWDGICP
jgi:hypothetical protein